MISSWVSGGISGGHINPAVRTLTFICADNMTDIIQVTLTLATWRGFPWKKVPSYIFAQVMGGLCGAALIYGNYFHAIGEPPTLRPHWRMLLIRSLSDLFEGGVGIRTLSSASLFSTYSVCLFTLMMRLR